MNAHEYLPDPWRDYRRRTRLFLVLLAAAVPVFAFVAYCVDQYRWPVAAAVVAVAWVVAISATAIRLQFFPCPNCGKPFAYNVINRLPLTVGHCVHCGLPKWQH